MDEQQFVCEFCDAPFTRRRSQPEPRFCSRRCMVISNRCERLGLSAAQRSGIVARWLAKESMRTK